MLKEDHGGKVVYGGKYDLKDRFIEPCLVENPKENS
jgi:hypothetical protein